MWRRGGNVRDPAPDPPTDPPGVPPTDPAPDPAAGPPTDPPTDPPTAALRRRRAPRSTGTTSSCSTAICPASTATVLRIDNAGPVIPRDQVAGLFQPFRRPGAERIRTRPRPRPGGKGHRREGLGLGLSIVTAVSTAHGGTVEAWPRPRGGLTVRVTFPPCAPPVPPRGPADAPAGRVRPTEGGRSPSEAARRAGSPRVPGRRPHARNARSARKLIDRVSGRRATGRRSVHCPDRARVGMLGACQ
ncbi:ATP-binding protein [Streptomyces sp. NPDC091209]|uniref:ATP-binding protein n=1 Tax=Streptomyces sp. NPDC091209 TaxID=3365974 RepID=UPI0037FDB834